MHFSPANFIKVQWFHEYVSELVVLGLAKGRRYSLVLLSMIFALISAPPVRDEELVGSHNEKRGTRRLFSSSAAPACQRAIRVRRFFFFALLPDSRFRSNLEVT